MSIQTVPVMRPVAPPIHRVVRELESVHASGIFSNFGPRERRLRERFAERFGVSPELVATASNATLALTGIAATAHVDRWIVPSFTFAATAAAAGLSGGRFRFGDIEAFGWWLRPGPAVPAEGSIVVAPFGADPSEVLRGATGEVVLDAAASLGSDLRLTGLSPTTSVVFSLHATKVLGAGEGAIVAFGDAGRAMDFRTWTNFGFAGSRESQIAAVNAKMSEMQAAYVHAALDGWEQERAEWIAARDRVLRVGDEVGLTTFHASREQVTPYWIAILPDATTTDVVERVLADHGIGTRRWWSRGCHRMPAYTDVPHGPLPVTEDIADRYLGLPLYRGLSEQDAERIRDALLDARGRAESW